jgi:uncharacterized membrane protein YfcA
MEAFPVTLPWTSNIPFGLLLAVALVAGFVGAISGMGGGVILVPVLTYLGMDIKHAIAMSMVAVIATSSGSASAYVRDHLTNLKVGMFLEMFTLLGALVGATITLTAERRGLYILFGMVLLVSVAALIVRRIGHPTSQPSAQDGISQWLELDGDYYDQALGKTISYRGVRAYLAGPLMLGAGLVAGLLGIGAGALKVLIFDLVMELPEKVATTTSNLVIGVTAVAGASVYLAAGLVAPGPTVPVMLGVLGGASVGTRLLVRLTDEKVRDVFMVVLLISALEMIVRGLRGGI